MPKKIELPVEEIISEYESGLSTYQLAEKYGVSSFTIRERLRENGVKIRPKKINLPMEEIISEYESGLSVLKLADKYGVNHSVIYKRLEENGVKLRPRDNKIKLPMEEVISYYQSGMTTIQLAEKYGVAFNTIGRKLKENGVKLRSRGGKINLPMEEIISEYQSGLSTYQLGEKYGVKSDTIGKRLKENGVKLRPKGRDKSKIKLPMEEVISYYQSGMSLKQLGEKYGVSPSAIYRRLKWNGVKLRPSRNVKRIDLPVEEIISHYQSGMTLTQLAEKYGVSYKPIIARLKENGVK